MALAATEMYVVLIREKGLFLVEPVPGQAPAATIEAVLGVGGGYSAGLVAVDLAPGATEAWVAWVEGETTTGTPYFEYRTLDGSLSEAEVESTLAAAGESVLRLGRSEIHRLH